MRTIGLQNPICIVLDSINLPILEAGSAPAWRKKIPASAKILLYLGRLHAKKGLANLLHAWESLRTGRQPIGILWLSVGIREATKVSSSSWFVSEAWREFIFQVRCLVPINMLLTPPQMPLSCHPPARASPWSSSKHGRMASQL